MENKKITSVIVAFLVIAFVAYYGMFRVSSELPNTPAPEGKLNINVVCESALAYMSFPDGESAEIFVNDCKEGKHPEVIEQYKAQMGLGDGATI